MQVLIRSLFIAALHISLAAQADHWAYVRPQRPTEPAVSDPNWVNNGIDAFVLKRLERAGLHHAAESSRAALIRRVSLDLTGLPPTLEAIDAFLADDSPKAYAKVVDRMLASPAYGERWAQLWLDLARYADTKGYEKDARRNIWPYRDWVIDAFNRDLPFDQFTVEQIAGDLLPSPTDDQIIATAFHRNTMTNDEGGTDNEEFRTAAVVDRINTTMEVWMGTTFTCSQCHDHKFDPFSQREYFELYALLNNTEDRDLNNDAPLLETRSRADREQARVAQAKIDRIEKLIEKGSEPLDSGFESWLSENRKQLAIAATQSLELGTWRHKGPFVGKSFAEAHTHRFAPELDPELDMDISTWSTKANWVDGRVHKLSGDNSANYLARTVRAKTAHRVVLSLGSDDSIKVWHQGKLVLDKRTSRAAAADQERVELDLEAGDNQILIKITNGGGPSGFYFEIKNDRDRTLDSLLETSQPNADQVQRLHAAHRASIPTVRDPLAKARKQLATLPRSKTPIMRELVGAKRRETHIHLRGSFLDKGDKVSPGVPQVLHQFPKGTQPDRLALARWLVARDNPLTARVIVNRLWEQLYGRGLVTTLEDFGHQGDRPSHPGLLDWLAVEFMENNWSVKNILRTIVTSSTYRQSTRFTPNSAKRDPYNILLARGPRCRLTAEMIRDQALHASGLLNRTVHGPSVMPIQPDGIWQIVYSADAWKTSPGSARHRRGLYTFWRRTSPYPSMTTFDAPSREFCVGRRGPTNTPLQALVTLNDPVFVEAAQGLARRIILEVKGPPRERATYAFRLCTGRPARPEELDALTQLHETELTNYHNDADAAQKMATVPLGPAPQGMNIANLAAWTVVSNVLLSLDETLTRN